MSSINKKIVKIFSNGSVITSNTFFKKPNKIQISDKDHTTFICYQKKKNQTTTSSNNTDFKRQNYFL